MLTINDYKLRNIQYACLWCLLKSLEINENKNLLWWSFISHISLHSFWLPFFNLVSAERLCCPHFKFRACGCLQSYIIGDGKSVWNQDKSDLFCYTTKSCHLHLQCIFPTSILVSHWRTPLQSHIALKHCWKMYFIIQRITVKECSFTFL